MLVFERAKQEGRGSEKKVARSIEDMKCIDLNAAVVREEPPLYLWWTTLLADRFLEASVGTMGQ